MSDAQPTVAELDNALHQMLDENEALQAELARVRGRLLLTREAVVQRNFSMQMIPGVKER